MPAASALLAKRRATLAPCSRHPGLQGQGELCSARGRGAARPLGRACPLRCDARGGRAQAVPLYLSEMAPPQMRGGLNIMFQMATTIGARPGQAGAPRGALCGGAGGCMPALQRVDAVGRLQRAALAWLCRASPPASLSAALRAARARRHPGGAAGELWHAPPGRVVRPDIPLDPVPDSALLWPQPDKASAPVALCVHFVCFALWQRYINTQIS